MESLSYSIKDHKSGLLKDIKLKALELEHAYNLEIAKLNEEGKQIIANYEALRNEARAKVKFIWSIRKNNNSYTITRTPEHTIQGDEDFFKTIEYCPFNIINDVFIVYGGGYQHKVKLGTILTKDEINQIESGIVPEIFK